MRLQWTRRLWSVDEEINGLDSEELLNSQLEFGNPWNIEGFFFVVALRILIVVRIILFFEQVQFSGFSARKYSKIRYEVSSLMFAACD